MNDRLIEFGKCYAMEMNVDKKTELIEFQGKLPRTSYCRNKTTEKCKVFQVFE
jgi:hypothetical protein